MSEPKRKPRGVVARFLAGESVDRIALSLYHGDETWFGAIARVEAILRRALKEADVTGHHEHRFFTDEDGAGHGCRCGKAYVDGPLKKARKR